jgi:hypothetical protein
MKTEEKFNKVDWFIIVRNFGFEFGFQIDELERFFQVPMLDPVEIDSSVMS